MRPHRVVTLIEIESMSKDPVEWVIRKSKKLPKTQPFLLTWLEWLFFDRLSAEMIVCGAPYEMEVPGLPYQL